MSAVEKMLRRTSRNTSGEQITRKVLRRWVLTALITNVGTLSYVSSVEARMCHIDSRLVGEWDNKDATPNQSITKAGKNDDWIKLEFYCVSRNPQEDQWKSESVIIGVKDIRKTNQANTILKFN